MGIAVVLARQRSGTGALCEMMGAYEGFEACDEILLPGDGPRNFYQYVSTQKNTIASSDALCRAFERYLDGWTANSVTGLLNIKIAQLRSFAPSHWSISDPPWILETLKRRETKIIRMRRRNLVDQWVSGLLADANKVWHARSPSEISVRTVHVNRSQLEQFIAACKREDLLLDEVFSAYGSVLETTYESIFTPIGLDRNECLRISSFLGANGNVEEFYTPYVKQTNWGLSDKVENYAEIADLCGPRRSVYNFAPTSPEVATLAIPSANEIRPIANSFSSEPAG